MEEGDGQPEERAKHDEERQGDDADGEEIAEDGLRELVADVRGRVDYRESKDEDHAADCRDKTHYKGHCGRSDLGC